MTKFTKALLGLAIVAITAAPAAANGPKTDKQAPLGPVQAGSTTDSKNGSDASELGPYGGFLFYFGVPPEAARDIDGSQSGGMTPIDPPSLDAGAGPAKVESVIPQLGSGDQGEEELATMAAGLGLSTQQIDQIRSDRSAQRAEEYGQRAETDPEFRAHLQELANEGNLEAQVSLQVYENNKAIKDAVKVALENPQLRDQILENASPELRDAIKQAEADKAKQQKEAKKDVIKKAGQDASRRANITNAQRTQLSSVGRNAQRIAHGAKNCAPKRVVLRVASRRH